MFDPEKPYNKLPLLPPETNLNDVDILKLVNKANNSLFELKGSSRILPNRFILVSPFTIREAVASSGIENINTTVSKALKADALQKEKEPVGAEKEILHYRDALFAGLELLNKNDFLNTNSFIKIQSILEPKKSGIRKISGTKIINSRTKKTIYTPPEGKEIILSKLKNFEDYFNNKENFDEVDPLIRMAIMHYQFEAIHPFLDGNGRTGRILMVLYLVMTKRIDLPIIFLSKYILENRDLYYKSIEDITRRNKWKEWISFILNAIDIQATKTNNDILKIKILIKKYKKIGIEKKSKIINPQILDFLFSNPYYTQKTLSKELNIHRNTASKYFHELEKLNIIEKFTFKKKHIYFNKEFLKILNY